MVCKQSANIMQTNCMLGVKTVNKLSFFINWTILNDEQSTNGMLTVHKLHVYGLH